MFTEVPSPIGIIQKLTAPSELALKRFYQPASALPLCDCAAKAGGIGGRL